MAVTKTKTSTNKRNKKNPRDGTFVFVDVENVRSSAQGEGYVDLDYKKLFEWLKEKQNAKRIYLYLGIIDGDEKKENRYKKLAKIENCFVSIKKVKVYRKNPIPLKTICPKCKKHFDRRFYPKATLKANCDVELTLDAINFGVRKKYKRIIVFSGDGDFAKLYEYVAKRLEKKVIVYAPSDKGKDKRTAASVKKLNRDRVITLENLRGLFKDYAIK